MLEKKMLRLLSVVFLGLCFGIPVSAQIFIPPGATDTGLGGGNAITGTILLSTGQRLERRVSVRLQTMTTGDRVAMSDEYGNFAFRGLPSGEYTVVIEKEKDFEPFRQSVDIRQFRGSPPQVYPLSIRLQLKGQAIAKPGVLNAELADVPLRAQDFYKKGLESSETGKNEDAVKELKLAIAEYPKFALALTELGVQYQKLNQLDKAEEALRSALDIAPNSFAALTNYGIVLVRLKRYAEAEPILRRALKQQDKSAIAHFYLGRALAYTGRFEESKKELVAAIDSGGNEMTEAHRYLAGVYNALGDREHAIAELETYLRLAPKSDDAAQIRELIRKLKG
jgi:tetratricopeptide (TPR) repeat protein